MPGSSSLEYVCKVGKGERIQAIKGPSYFKDHIGSVQDSNSHPCRRRRRRRRRHHLRDLPKRRRRGRGGEERRGVVRSRGSGAAGRTDGRTAQRSSAISAFDRRRGGGGRLLTARVPRVVSGAECSVFSAHRIL